MNNSNLAYVDDDFVTEKDNPIEKSLNLSDTTWEYLVQEMTKVFRFTRKETKWFKNCKTAKLIATIPFAAGCEEPERTAIAHLCIYLAEIRGFQKYYAHLPSDDCDLFKRLGFISTFEGGNQDIIAYGMNLLALTMIEGYHKSENDDRKKGIYNPFVSGKWDYQTLKQNLLKEVEKYNFNTIMHLHDDNNWM